MVNKGPWPRYSMLDNKSTRPGCLHLVNTPNRAPKATSHPPRRPKKNDVCHGAESRNRDKFRHGVADQSGWAVTILALANSAQANSTGPTFGFKQFDRLKLGSSNIHNVDQKLGFCVGPNFRLGEAQRAGWGPRGWWHRQLSVECCLNFSLVEQHL